MRTYSQSKENCLRIPLLQSVGDCVHGVSSRCASGLTCCSVCSGGQIPCERLDILCIGPSKPIKRKGRKLREVDDCMKSTIKAALIKERHAFMLTNCPQMGILGPESVCSDAIIEDISSNSQNIASIEDINYFFLRPELQSRFFVT